MADCKLHEGKLAEKEDVPKIGRAFRCTLDTLDHAYEGIQEPLPG